MTHKTRMIQMSQTMHDLYVAPVSGNLAVELEIVHQYKRGDMVRYWVHNKQGDVIVSRVVHGRIESAGRAGREPMYYVYEGDKTQRLVSEQNIIGASELAMPVGQPYVTSKYLTVSTETRAVLSRAGIDRILRNRLQNRKP